MPRRATARCESEIGEVLVLQKADYKVISEQFPQFGIEFARFAMRRERRRVLKEAGIKFSGPEVRRRLSSHTNSCLKNAFPCILKVRRRGHGGSSKWQTSYALITPTVDVDQSGGVVGQQIRLSGANFGRSHGDAWTWSSLRSLQSRIEEGAACFRLTRDATRASAPMLLGAPWPWRWARPTAWLKRPERSAEADPAGHRPEGRLGCGPPAADAQRPRRRVRPQGPYSSRPARGLRER